VSRLVGGRYRIVETLGGGGTSLVYRAEPAGGGPDVALKELRPQLAADPVLRRRFLREAELARGLHHPGIVRLLDAGEDGGVPYLVMELVRAETLRQWLDRQGRLPRAVAESVVILLARALDHAHRRGVIHRDVKPQNVFVDSHTVKLADFGNARVVSLASVTGASLTWGTPEYIAPEMFMRGRADPRSDLYALGVVLFEMLAGRQPWSRAEVLTRLGGGARTAKPPATGAGEAVDRLIGELLAFSPADRPASGEEVVARLQAGETAVAVARVACPACGAERAPDIPRCLSCGREALRLRHDPVGMWRIVLERLEDDARATERLLRVLDPIAEPVKGPLHFLVGSRSAYSEQELKKGIGLPVVLFSNLDEGTARALESLFRENGVGARAFRGTTILEPAQAPEDNRRFGVVDRLAFMLGGCAAWVMHSNFGGIPLPLGAGITVGVGFAVICRWFLEARQRQKSGILTLREQPAAVPAAERLLEAAAGAGARVRAPEVRALLADVAAEVYRLTRRAGALGARRGAASSEADLVQRTAAAAPALVGRVERVATFLDALDGALEGPSEGELMQSLARLERAAAAPGADRDVAAAARRDLEATLERRHAAEHERARLSAALCGLLGRLRAVYRRVGALETLDEQEARALEAASAELDAFLT
jgi:hypothetical protein